MIASVSGVAVAACLLILVALLIRNSRRRKRLIGELSNDANTVDMFVNPLRQRDKARCAGVPAGQPLWMSYEEGGNRADGGYKIVCSADYGSPPQPHDYLEPTASLHLYGAPHQPHDYLQPVIPSRLYAIPMARTGRSGLGDNAYFSATNDFYDTADGDEVHYDMAHSPGSLERTHCTMATQNSVSRKVLNDMDHPTLSKRQEDSVLGFSNYDMASNNESSDYDMPGTPQFETQPTYAVPLEPDHTHASATSSSSSTSYAPRYHMVSDRLNDVVYDVSEI